MQRFDVINALIKKHGFKTYLEIGTQNDVCLSNVKCDRKVGVDPAPKAQDDKYCNKHYKTTSDAFFAQNKETFDIIFIDGLHHADQVDKDIVNSLAVLNKGGIIVMHDCNPLDELSQTVPMPHCPSWNGDVWKSFVRLRAARTDLDMFVVDTDWGCGIVQSGTQELLAIEGGLTYSQFDKNRSEWLNLITKEEFNKRMN